MENRKKAMSPLAICLVVMVFAFVLLALLFLPSENVIKQIPLSDKVLSEAGLIRPDNQPDPFVELSYPSRGNQGDMMTIKSLVNFVGYALPEKNDKLVVEFLLNLDGSKITPDGEVLHPILGNYPALASWQVVPFIDGKIKGTLWIHLQVISGNDDVKRFLLMAYPYEIQSISFLGLPIGFIRIFCIAVAVISGLTALALGIRLWVGNIRH